MTRLKAVHGSYSNRLQEYKSGGDKMDYKECDLGVNKRYREVMDGFLPNLEDFYHNPEKYNIEPFRIFGNLYYVGDKKYACIL